MGRSEVTVYCHVTKQEPLPSERVGEDELIEHGRGGPIMEVSKWMRKGDTEELAKLEARLLQEPDKPEYQLCLALLLAEKTDKDRAEALRIFERIHEENALPVLRIFAQRIPLLLGEPELAREASQELLDSGALSHEWRGGKHMANYQAGRMSEEDFIAYAGPFGDFRCDLYHEIGVRALAAGDRPKAKRFFEHSVATGQVATWHYHEALIYLDRLENDPTWPSWIESKPNE
jgi:hypothetical protein